MRIQPRFFFVYLIYGNKKVPWLEGHGTLNAFSFKIVDYLFFFFAADAKIS